MFAARAKAIAVLSLTFAAGAPAATPDQLEFFESHIRPVLARSCYACHSSAAKSPMGGLRLDTPEGIQSVADSKLLDALSYRGRVKMPPAGKLPDDQLADFIAWSKMGAPSPKASPQSSGRNQWAFRPVQNPPIPPVKDTAWIQSPIDAFILSKLESRGLRPAAPASKRELIRRVTFDLTGLPPAPEEVNAFLADHSREAFRRVVDRLLDSPRYGERWARHWLDLVRYAETNGHEYDNDKLDPWRYRDYVIRAFNQDVPYDDLVREHIAGDLLAKKRATPDGAALDSPLATTFFWFGEVLNSATDPVKSRADEVDNQIDVAGKAFLGLTVACARCHDHKFDPIPTADYYSLAGVFHSTVKREDVIDSPDRTRTIQALSRQIRAAIGPAPRRRVKIRYRPEDEVFDSFDGGSYTKWTTAGAAFGDAPEQGLATSLAGGSDRFVGTLTSRRFHTSGKLFLHVRISGSKGDENAKERGSLRFTLVNGEFKAQHIVPDGNEYPAWRTLRLALERNRDCYFEIVDRSTTGHISVDEIVFSDLEKPPVVEEEDPVILPRRAPAELEAKIPESSFAMLAADYEPHDIRIHMRGSHENLGAETPRRFLRVIAGEDQPPVRDGSGRLQIAERFASPRNPLTARVMVNRIWRYHFGQGIVKTTDNFGAMGEAPNHPELLDYLATRFVEGGWSVKAMHRLIVLSSAYQMSSVAGDAAAKADPENRLLHHVPVRRLESEEIRDAILAAAGTLDPTMYGPSVAPHISKYQDGRGKPASGPLDGAGRRSIYIQVRRNFLTPLFLAFDYPLPISSIGSRSSSTVPSQALLMMNNEFIAEQANRWARRVTTAASDPAARVRAMYEIAFARPPSKPESDAILKFLDGRDNVQAWTDVAHVLFNSAEFIYVQ